jgi:hypothetical protein
MFIHRSWHGCLAAVLVIAAVLVGCGNKETGKGLAKPSLSFIRSPSVQPTGQPAIQATGRPANQATGQPIPTPTPTPFIPGPLFYPNLDLKVRPVDVPLELQIPSLNVNAPVLGVGLTAGNEMDAPKGPIGDPVWNTAFWYRGSVIPGQPGTATFAGHVNDPLGQPEIFAHLQKLNPGDPIIVHVKNTTIDIPFMVDQVKVYSIQEVSNPSVIEKIFGSAPLAGAGPQPAPDGLSHLTLITCAGKIVKGQYDHYTVVYATRSK